MTQPLRVLVVDDSAPMRKLIPKILRRDDSIEVVHLPWTAILASRIEESCDHRS
jgi:chemotaxis response regulator CheB